MPPISKRPSGMRWPPQRPGVGPSIPVDDWAVVGRSCQGLVLANGTGYVCPAAVAGTALQAVPCARPEVRVQGAQHEPARRSLLRGRQALPCGHHGGGLIVGADAGRIQESCGGVESRHTRWLRTAWWWVEAQADTSRVVHVTNHSWSSAQPARDQITPPSRSRLWYGAGIATQPERQK